MAWLLPTAWLAGTITSPPIAGAAPWKSGAPPQAINPAPDQTDDPLASLRSGQLILWVLQPEVSSPAAAPAVAAAAAAPRSAPAPTYQEHEAGSFGQTAGSFGVDAGSYGVPSSSSHISAPPAGTGYHQQTSGSFGQTASNFGTAAGDYGQNAGSAGQTAGSFGVESNRIGQTAGSFGNSVSTIAQAGIHPVTPARSLSPEHSRQLQQLEQGVQTAFPDLHVKYISLDPGALESELAAAQTTQQYPDLLVAPSPAAWWQAIQREFALATLQPASFYPDGVTQNTPSSTQVAILAHAPHMVRAQAFATWMNEAGLGCPGCVLHNASKNAQAAAMAAADAVARLLRGEPIGDEADTAMAAFPPQIGPAMLTNTAGTLPSNAPVRIDLMHASANGRLAAVALRVIAFSSNVFAVAHPLVVLRRAADGRWRVLHISLDLPPAQQQDERETLINSISVASERHVSPMGIRQASPPDGDTRPPQPELWWDNAGGATLQVVEWQMRNDSYWSDPHLYLAPDVGSRLRTRVTAAFAISPATYRWRVWSVGFHGEMKISSWNTLNIVQ